MKRFLVIALLVCGSTGAQERFSNGFTQKADAFFRGGFWWAQDNPGFGLDLHRAGDQIVGIWATYDTAGDATWYFGTASEQGDDWVMPLHRYTWNGSIAQGQPAGEIRLSFDGGYAATMQWQLGAAQGSESIAPLIAREQPTVIDQTGFWYDPERPGFGYSVATQGDVLMSVLYFYDSAGQPRWAWADNIGTGDLSAQMDLLSFTGTCPGCATRPGESRPAGNLRFTFLSETLGGAHARVTLADRSWDQLSDIALLSDRPSGRSAEPQLIALTNADMLAAWQQQANQSYPVIADVNFSPAEPLTVQTSTTNLQEAGVDESDLVKTDGEYLYVLNNASGAATLRILAIQRASTALEPVAKAILFDGESPAQGMYLVTATEQPLLVVTSAQPDYFYEPFWLSSTPWKNQSGRVEIYAIADPSRPLRLASLELDGALVESRVVGNRLYTVSRDLPDSRPFNGGAADLPTLRIDGGVAQPLVDARQILVPPQAPGYNYGDLITLAAFDLDKPASAPQTVSFLGLAETIYASTENIYLTSSRYGYGVAPLAVDDNALLLPAQPTTHIHRFALTPEGVRYAASGEIAGFAGPGRVNPAFALSEHDNHLRVVSQGIGFDWDAYQLSVLSLTPQNGQMPVVGFAPNQIRPQPIGKPGESLYGLRFLGERLYAVTFKKTDPLYVIDLANPADPRVAGELEISGFSNYLHPLEGDLLLGFGKSAVDAQGPGDGDFAWYQGLQVSLFDVAEPTRPELVDRLELGRRGSESSLLYEHHAFAMLPSDQTSGRPVRLAIPLVIHDARGPEELSDAPNHFYDFQYTGLGMFEVSNSGASARLVLRDTLVTHTAETDPGRDGRLDSMPAAARAVISEDNAYFYLHGQLFSSSWGFGLPVAGPF